MQLLLPKSFLSPESSIPGSLLRISHCPPHHPMSTSSPNMSNGHINHQFALPRVEFSPFSQTLNTHHLLSSVSLFPLFANMLVPLVILISAPGTSILIAQALSKAWLHCCFLQEAFLDLPYPTLRCIYYKANRTKILEALTCTGFL